MTGSPPSTLPCFLKTGCILGPRTHQLQGAWTSGEPLLPHPRPLEAQLIPAYYGSGCGDLAHIRYHWYTDWVMTITATSSCFIHPQKCQIYSGPGHLRDDIFPGNTVGRPPNREGTTLGSSLKHTSVCRILKAKAASNILEILGNQCLQDFPTLYGLKYRVF